MSRRMSQPAAPAAMIVTALFLITLIVWRTSEAVDPLLHIRSAILKTSQPRAAKPTIQNSIAETMAFSSFYMKSTTLSAVASSNKLLRSNPRARGIVALQPGF
jgi:hypothetical protein